MKKLTNPKCYSKPVSCGLCTFLLAIGLFTMPATARCGTIFVGNRNGDVAGAGTIGEYTTSGATVNPALVSGLTEPFPVAVSGGNLFVIDNFSSAVGKYTTSGAVVNPALVSLELGTDIALSGGNLFALQGHFSTSRVSVYNATTGATVNPTLVSLNEPFGGIAVSGGNLFVAQSVAGTIGVYNAVTGATVNPALISGLNFPEFIKVSGGNLFVTEIGGTIGEYNATTGAPVNPALVSGLNMPTGIAVVTVPETSSTGTLLLLALTAMFGLKPLLRRPA